MSYILDALKKAAEQRSGPPPEVRRLLSAHYVPVRSPSRAVVLTVAGAAIVGVALGLWVWTPLHELAAPTAAPVTSLAAIPNESSLPPAAARDDKPRVSADDRPRSPTPVGASDEPHPAASEPRRAPTKPRVAETTPPRTSPPGAASPAPTPRVVASPAPSAIASPAPAPGVVAVTPPTPRLAASPPPAPRVVPSPPAAGAPAAQRADAGKLKVEVIVYAEERPHRWAFINGRKYVEGDAIGDGGRVEEIQSNGVVVVEDGRRVTLRP